MGVVFKARQIKLNRLVALKLVLAGAHAGGEDLARFKVEAEAVAHLQHPNIVGVYEVGESSDGAAPLPYMALEYVEGGTLARRLAGHPQPIRTAGELVETLARAIHYCHQRGIVHRDLKPANVLLGTPHPNPPPQGGRGTLSPSPLVGEGWGGGTLLPKITDFGLAKMLEGPADRTQAGAVLGTAGYMAPEQAGGLNREVGPAADVYALGAILYECLTGRPPFKGDTPSDTLRQVLFDEPIPPRRLRTGVPTDLETICLKCLQKEPSRRYSTAHHLAEDLRRFLDGKPIAARPVGTLERAWKWARRRPAVAALSAAVAVVTLAGVLLVTWKWREALANARAESEARHEAQQKTREAERLLAGALVDRAVSLCETGDVGQGLHWLVRALEVARQAGDADGERVCRLNLSAWRRALLRERAALPHKDWVWAGACSPDGKTVLTGSKDQTARLWDALTGRPLGQPMRHDHPVWCVAFSPDGKTAVTGSGSQDGKQGQSRLWDAATGKPLGPPLPADGRVDTAAFSSDGTRLLTLGGRKARLWNVAQVANLSAEAPAVHELSSRVPHPAPVLSASFHPDGRTVLTAGGDGTARLWDVATGMPQEPTFLHPGPVDAAAFSPDGRTLATSCWRLNEKPTQLVGVEARLWDVTTGKQVGAVLPQRGPVKALAFSPDGRLLLTAGIVPADVGQDFLKGEARLWDAGSAEPLGPSIDHARPVWAVAFSPDGRTFLTGCEDQSARLWLTATGQQIGPRMYLRDLVRAVAFSPDGRLALLASAGAVAQARLWEVPLGGAQTLPLRHPGPVALLALSPGGGRLLVSGDDSTSRLWDIATRQPVGPPLHHPAQLTAAAFSPDGRTVATVGGGALEQWDASTGAAVRPRVSVSGQDCAAAFSPDFRALVTGELNVACRLDLANGERLAEPVPCPGGASAVAFHPSGRMFATGGREGFRLWDTVGNGLRLSAAHEGPIHVLVFSPDGRLFLTGGQSPRAQLWETATGRPACPPFRHDGWVRAVAFSPDGRMALTGDERHKARLWDVITGKPLGAPLPHGGTVGAVAFHADGERFFTGSTDGAVRFWDLPEPWAGAPDRVRQEVELLTGMELDERGTARRLSADNLHQRRRGLPEL